MMQKFKVLSSLPPEIRRTSVIYSLLQFFYYFNFFWLIQNIFFLESGIDYKQLSIVLGVWSVSIVLLEIPSGILADKFGRKVVVITGKLAFLAGLLCFFLFQNFTGFVIGMLFWGIHDAFLSGALEALIYDDLKEKQQQNYFQKVLSLATSSREIGLGVGVLIAGFVADANMVLVMFSSVVSATIAVYFALLLPRASSSQASSEQELLAFDVLKLVKKIATHTHLRTIAIFSLTTVIAYTLVSEFALITLKELGLSFTIIGIFAFFEMLSFLIGVQYAEKKPVTVLVYQKLTFAMLGGILLMITHSLSIVVIALLFMRIIHAYGEIAVNTDWQHGIESKYRATTTSILSFAKNIWYVPVAYSFGVLADNTTVFDAFWLPALLSFGYIVISGLLVKSKKSSKYQ